MSLLFLKHGAKSVFWLITDATSDIGASESIMKKKTKQEFQELLKTEHCKKQSFEVIMLLCFYFCLWMKCAVFVWGTFSFTGRLRGSGMYRLHWRTHWQTGMTSSAIWITHQRSIFIHKSCVMAVSQASVKQLTISLTQFLCIFHQISMTDSLRLLCLLSLTENGESYVFLSTNDLIVIK